MKSLIIWEVYTWVGHISDRVLILIGQRSRLIKPRSPNFDDLKKFANHASISRIDQMRQWCIYKHTNFQTSVESENLITLTQTSSILPTSTPTEISAWNLILILIPTPSMAIKNYCQRDCSSVFGVTNFISEKFTSSIFTLSFKM